MKKSSWLWLAVNVFLLAGCDALSIFSSPIQERGVDGFFSDNFALRPRINQILAQEQEWSTISVLIYKGRVLLVGTAKNQNIKNRILQKVRSLAKITEIIDEISISDYHGIDMTQDASLERDVKAWLFFNPTLSSQDYTLAVVGRVLYVLGVAQNKEEIEALERYAETKGSIKRFVNYLILAPVGPRK